MSMSGSGIGGNIGALSQPTINEREQTAANEILKLGYGLAITHDTLDLAFYEVGGQIGRYPANPSRPILPPLISARGSTGLEEADNAARYQILSILVNMLPLAVKSDYMYEMSLYPGERNLNFVALDAVLTGTASAIVWIQTASNLSATEGVKEAQKAMNLAIPMAALEALTDFGGAALTGAKNFLDNAGANYPQQDGLRNYVRLIDKNLSQLQDLLEGTSPSLNTISDKSADLFAKITVIADQYNRVSPGDDLRILGALLSSMQLVMIAAASAANASPSFFLGLSMGSVGIYSSDSISGMITPSLSMAIKGLTVGVIALLIPNAGLAVEKQLELTIATTILGAMTVAIMVQNEAKNNKQEENSNNQTTTEKQAIEEQAKKFATQLTLTLIVHSGVINSTLSALVDTFGLVPAQQKYLENTLNLLALATIALASTPEGNPDSASSLFDSLQGSMVKHLTSLSDLVSEQIMNQTIQGEIAQRVGISLEQAKQALEKGKADDFIFALLSITAPLGADAVLLMDGIKELKSSTSNLIQLLSGSIEDQTNTQTKINIIV